MATNPTIKVEFDANPTQAGEFVLDVSLLDGTDTLTTSPRWVDISTLDIAAVSGTITQGRQNIDNPVQAGQFTMVVDNFSGNYDPDNTHGVFSPYLIRGMLCRVSAVVSAVTYVLFIGRLETVNLEKDLKLQASLTFVDDLQIAGLTQMTSYNTAVRAETSLSRATWLTTMLYPWLYASPSLSSNLTRNLLPTYGGGTVLDMLNTVAVAEQGHLYVDPNGVLTLTAHTDDLTATLLGTLTDDPTVSGGIEYEALTASSGRTQVVIGAIVDRYNRNDSNYPSQYGGNVGGGLAALGAVVSVLAPLSSDSDAQALATYLATRRSSPPPSIDSVRVNMSQANATVLLGAKLGQQITTHRSVPYTTGTQVLDLQAAIEGITWEFWVGAMFGTFYTATTDITSLFGGAGPFTLDVSLLDGADLLTAY